MAEPTPLVRDPGPPLGSTADPVGYVPVAWVAVAAFAVMLLFVVVLGVMGVMAWRTKSPLITPEMLFLPAVAVVLAFTARRVVRNSEGTRTGELFGVDLIASAWWGSVVVGLVYLTYMAAVDYSVKREATAEITRWVKWVTDGNQTNAFHRTRDPAERAQIAPDDADGLEKRYRNEWIIFHLADVTRIAARNPGACEFLPGGLKDWSIKGGGVECVATGVFRSPEGDFPVQFGMKAIDAVPGGGEAAAGRQWMVKIEPGGFLAAEPKITPYGWLLFDYQRQAREAAGVFIANTADRNIRPFAAVQYAQLTAEPDFRPYTLDVGMARLAAVGVTPGLGFAVPESFYTNTARRLHRLPGNKPATPGVAKEFNATWAGVAPALIPAGVRLKQSPDVHDLIYVTDTTIEARVPVEIPTTGGKGDAVARGRVVMVCDDPAAVAEAKKLRAEATPAAGTLAPPTAPRPSYRWRVDRIETDMRPYNPSPGDGPGGPGGGPPGMGG